jgi:ABC-2 type transport system permease protein
MKKIYRIAKTELSTLFFSPVAWLVLVIFTFQCALTLTDTIYRFASWIRRGAQIEDLTVRIFSDRSFFNDVQRNLYLYLPLLTMGLISRELSSGSIKLLFSAPVKLSQIVLGKYLAIVTYCLLMALVLLIFTAVGQYAIFSMDTGLVLSGVFGLFLLICAYSAIGLFMSSLTSYQVVAAISTLAVLALLSFIGTLWQDVDFVKDITYFLSISGRSEKMISGLISTKDVLYFVLVITLFLGLTVLKLKAGRESKPAIVKTGRYALFIGAILIAGYITSRPVLTGYLDMTATKTRTLTVNTQNVLKQLTKPLKVTTYANIFDNNFYFFIPTQFNNDLDRMEQYTRFLPRMKFDYVFYYDTSVNTWSYNPASTVSIKDQADTAAQSFDMGFKKFLSPAEIKKVIDLGPEQNRIVRLWEYDGKRGFTRMFADSKVHPSEQEITAVLKAFLVPQPKIAFVKGNFERDINRSGDKDYKMVTHQLDFRYALINQGFLVDTLSLKTQEIPTDIACLVIADPKSAYSPEELAKINQYVANGGNVMISGEQGRQSILNPVIKPLGVQMNEGVLIQQSKDFAPNLVFGKYGPKASTISKWYASPDDKISLMNAAGLTIDSSSGFTVNPVLVTDSKDTWNKLGKVNLDSGAVSYNPENGDQKKTIAVGVGLTRKVAGKEQKIMIFGDADFMSTAEITSKRDIQTKNFYLSLGAFKWFNNNEFPIDTERPETQDKKLNVDQGKINVLKIIFMGVLPALIIAAGTILLIRRKRN